MHYTPKQKFNECSVTINSLMSSLLISRFFLLLPVRKLKRRKDRALWIKDVLCHWADATWIQPHYRKLYFPFLCHISLSINGCPYTIFLVSTRGFAIILCISTVSYISVEPSYVKLLTNELPFLPNKLSCIKSWRKKNWSFYSIVY